MVVTAVVVAGPMINITVEIIAETTMITMAVVVAEATEEEVAEQCEATIRLRTIINKTETITKVVITTKAAVTTQRALGHSKTIWC